MAAGLRGLGFGGGAIWMAAGLAPLTRNAWGLIPA